MSTLQPTDYPIDPSTVDGDELALRLNRQQEALITSHSSATRPTYIKAGGLWAKTVTGGIELYLYDGTNDVLIVKRTNNQTNHGSTNTWISATQPTHAEPGDLWLNHNVLKVLTNQGWMGLQQTAWVGQLFTFSTPTLPAGFPGFICNGSTVPNGRLDFPALAQSGSLWVDVVGDDLLIHDAADVIRGQGSSGRAVGEFEGDAIRNITGYFCITNNAWVERSSDLFTIQVNGTSHSLQGVSGQYATGAWDFDASKVVPTATENRVKSKTALFAIYHGEII